VTHLLTGASILLPRISSKDDGTSPVDPPHLEFVGGDQSDGGGAEAIPGHGTGSEPILGGGQLRAQRFPRSSKKGEKCAPLRLFPKAAYREADTTSVNLTVREHNVFHGKCFTFLPAEKRRLRKGFLTVEVQLDDGDEEISADIHLGRGYETALDRAIWVIPSLNFVVKKGEDRLPLESSLSSAFL